MSIDREIIAWARQYGAAHETFGLHERADAYKRLADLAEKGAEDWQPIATAPENTNHAEPLLFLSRYGNQFIGYRSNGDTMCDGQFRDATHWRPLPAPPGGVR